ncbi:MAG: hypothetical protein JRC86_03355 [Deltaproteobacteria bacterium]|nr:hypothetical protein [Deltaproteobacteria bacterium]
MKGEEIVVDNFPGRIRVQREKYVAGENTCSLRKRLEDAEKNAIIETLRLTGGSKLKASKMLGIHRTGLYQKVKKYQIEV